MKRRDFVKTAAMGVASGGVLMGCRPAGPAAEADEPRVMWRLASSYTPALDVLFGAAQGVAQRVEAMTNGRFRIRAYPAGDLVPAMEVFDAVQQGTVQMAHTASYYFIGKQPALAFDTGVPFGLTARQQMAWISREETRALFRDLFSSFNIVHFPGGNTGAQMGGWFRREIRSLADLKGLKMRIPGLGGQVMSRLGVTVQMLSAGEAYPALERGAIDAIEWVGPHDDEKLGFYKVAPYYYYPSWWEGGSNTVFYVNKTAFENLPLAYRQVLEAACAEAAQTLLLRYDSLNPFALERLLAYGAKLREYPADILNAARKETDAMMRELAAGDSAYAALYENWKAYKAVSDRWFGTAEFSYAQCVFGDLARQGGNGS